MIDNLDLPVLRLSYPDFKITDINQKAYNFVKGLKPEIKSIFSLKGQNYTEIVVIIIDVTKEIKDNLHVEENLKMQEEFLANITHELKTPLNVIFSSSQLFELYLKNNSLGDNKDKIRKIIYSTRQNCYRLTKLISNIVDLSKICLLYTSPSPRD